MQRKSSPLQLKCPCKANLLLNKVCTQEKLAQTKTESALDFFLRKVVTTSFPHWLPSDLTVLSHWLVWKELAHKKWRSNGKRITASRIKGYCFCTFVFWNIVEVPCVNKSITEWGGWKHLHLQVLPDGLDKKT